jgi:chromosome segregation ATPase
MSAEMITALTGLVVGLVSIYIASLSRRDQAKKSEMDILQGLVETLQRDAAAMRDEIKLLKTENVEIRNENRKLRIWVRALSKQVESLGQVPVSPPAEGDA